ncbi:polysaccharide deacetylase family protein [Alicyclobacillus sp. SO9]|uniref:polysaccharide deacetylase family protein n=1 Tax=Alicyclobacillus sp. SO9 TaxID=2665646 RepID=UPI0018E86736|nr:polysaccharide deacetylase family protein [Alicyclobacillus sp. SO9]QQE80852.1 polysaccharide deacetylase family protein [Alicyclobacillus sp. SO9]
MRTRFRTRQRIGLGLGLAVSLALVLTLVLQQCGAGAVQGAVRSNKTPDWADIAEELNQQPVNAKFDRIWQAVPGLNGWKLEIDKSRALTQRDKDGRVHLVWAPVMPETDLNDIQTAPIYRGPKQEKSATLMFNVSWGEEHVPQILSVLKENGIKATFFLDGAWVRDNPTLAAQVAEYGEDIGSHGIGHKDFKKLSNVQLGNQLDTSAKVIADKTHAKVRLIAPPAGSYDQRLVKVASARHMKVILWTVDTIDWRRPPSAQIVHRVDRRIQPGSLILMHPTASTARALPQVIHDLKEKGYVFKTVSQVVSEQSVIHPPSVLKDPL